MNTAVFDFESGYLQAVEALIEQNGHLILCLHKRRTLSHLSIYSKSLARPITR